MRLDIAGRQSRLLDNRSVWRDAEHAQGSLNNAGDARRRLWRLNHLSDAAPMDKIEHFVVLMLEN
jgi:hypothetical protein